MRDPLSRHKWAPDPYAVSQRFVCLRKKSKAESSPDFGTTYVPDSCSNDTERRVFYQTYSPSEMKWAVGEPLHVKECLRKTQPVVETELTKKSRWESCHTRDFPGHVPNFKRHEIPAYERIHRRPIRHRKLQVPEKPSFVGLLHPIPKKLLLQQAAMNRKKKTSKRDAGSVDGKGSLFDEERASDKAVSPKKMRETASQPELPSSLRGDTPTAVMCRAYSPSPRTRKFNRLMAITATDGLTCRVVARRRKECDMRGTWLRGIPPTLRPAYGSVPPKGGKEDPS